MSREVAVVAVAVCLLAGCARLDPPRNESPPSQFGSYSSDSTAADTSAAVADGPAIPAHRPVPPKYTDYVMDHCASDATQVAMSPADDEAMSDFNQCVNQAIDAAEADEKQDLAAIAKDRSKRRDLAKCKRSTDSAKRQLCSILTQVIEQNEDLRVQLSNDPDRRCYWQTARYGKQFFATCVAEEHKAAARLKSYSSTRPDSYLRCKMLMKGLGLAMTADCVENGTGDDASLDEQLGLPAYRENLQLLRDTQSKTAALPESPSESS